MDLSKLSDDELQQLYDKSKSGAATATATATTVPAATSGSEPPKAPSATTDLSKLSDAELQALADKTAPFSFGRWAGTQATNAASGLLSIGRSMADTKRSIIVGIAKRLGVSDDTAEKIAMGINAIDPMTGMAQFAPTQQQIADFANKQTGLKPQNAPESWGVGGKMLDAGTQAALQSLAFPAGGVASVVRNVVPAAVGGAVSEGAGNIPGVKGTPWEMPIRTAAGLLAGTVTGAGQNTAIRPRGVATPLPDTALQALGFTDKQVAGMTPELRQAVSDAAHRTFSNQEAVQSAYRAGILKEQGIVSGQPGGPTRGEITGDPGQITREQKLAGPGEGQATILNNRAAQDVNLNQAQQRLQTDVAGGMPPQSAAEATQVLKQNFVTADQTAKANVDQLYGAARDPFAVEAQGGRPSVPPAVTGSLHQATRSALAQNDIGRIALGSEASNLTPNAAAALSAVDKWSKSTMGPRTNLVAGPSQPSMVSSPGMSVYRPQGLLAGEELPPGATTTRMAIDQPGVRVNVPPQSPSAEASLAAQTAPPVPGGPRITGPSPTGQMAGDVNWSKVEDLRQALVGYEEQAIASGNKQDIAAVQQIKKNFDDQFGPLNPLFGPARAAHADRMSTFKPGGSPDQDKATKTTLQLLAGPEEGAKVANSIFANANQGDALKLVDHLQSKVFPNSPEALGVLRQQAISRLTQDPKTGKMLTPQEQATAIGNALDGNAQGPLYEKIFEGTDFLAALRRRQEAVTMLGQSRKNINPPSSGLLTIATLKSLAKPVLGGGAGYLTGIPGLETAGAAAGFALDKYLPPFQASRAVRPPANYGTRQPFSGPGVAAGGVAPVPGILSANSPPPGQPGPADRIMGLLTTGQGL